MRFGFVVLLTLIIAGNAGAQSAQTLASRADSVMKAAEKEGFGGVVRIEKEGAVVLEKRETDQDGGILAHAAQQGDHRGLGRRHPPRRR